MKKSPLPIAHKHRCVAKAPTSSPRALLLRSRAPLRPAQKQPTVTQTPAYYVPTPLAMAPDISRIGDSQSPASSGSRSPEAEQMERSLLDATDSTDYVGRRPSASGRDTKRISMSPIYCNRTPFPRECRVPNGRVVHSDQPLYAMYYPQPLSQLPPRICSCIAGRGCSISTLDHPDLA